jgi:hypothetical protein
MNDTLHRDRLISIIIFVVGLCAFLGVDSFKDIYFELRAKATGEFIDYSKLSEFCGWTGQPLPGESKFAYGLRATWNMVSTMLAVSVIGFIALGLVGGVIFLIFYRRGAFDS